MGVAAMHDLDDTIQELRSTEVGRLAALVERDMDTANRLHAGLVIPAANC